MNPKLDEQFLRDVWIATFGAMMAGKYPFSDYGMLDMAKDASIQADAAVEALRQLECRKIEEQQNTFKKGDKLTTQHGGCFEVVSIDLKKGSMMLLDGHDRPREYRRVRAGSRFWKPVSGTWPDDLEPYVFRLEDRPLILEKRRKTP